MDRETRTLSSVLRLAIILTDGHSNQHNSSCGFNDIEQAATEIHGDLEPILVFVIGVTNNIKEEELKQIATFDDFTHIDTFEKDTLTDTQLQHTDTVCHRGKYIHCLMHLMKICQS